MPGVLTHDEKVKSFVEATCTDKVVAERCLERCGGNLHVAVERFFLADEMYVKWDRTPTPVGSPVKQTGKRDRGEEEEGAVPTQPVGKVPKREAGSSVKDVTPPGVDEPLPWENLNTELPAAECFSYDAIKSKLVQSNYQGPQDGSTWLWYLIGDMSVYPDESKNSKSASVHLTGDKFQAGWLRNPKEPVPKDTITKRQYSMVESVMNDCVNSYGKHRGGCQPGYRHRWNYADSKWSTDCAAGAVQTTATSWDEEKGEDRWAVNVHMLWESPAAIPEGKYLVVADQRAEKLNKNQYQTNMRGRRWYVGAIDDAPEKIEAAKKKILATLLPPNYKFKKPAKPVKDVPAVPKSVPELPPPRRG